MEKGYNLFSTLGPQGMILWGVVCTTHLGTATKFDNAGFSEYCIYSSEVWTSVLHPKFSIILNSRSTLSYENTVIAPNVWSCIRKKSFRIQLLDLAGLLHTKAKSFAFKSLKTEMPAPKGFREWKPWYLHLLSTFYKCHPFK